MSELIKAVVRRLIEGVINAGRLELIDELYSPEAAEAARHWVEPFRVAFPDIEMRTIELVAEGDRVVGRFRC
jgi:predicted ester cyclase